MIFRLGGSYLNDMKDLRDKDEQMDTIREFFLEMDKDLLEKNNRRNMILDSCSEVTQHKYVHFQ